GGLRLGQNVLRHLDSGRAHSRNTGRTAALQRATLSQHLARGRRLHGEGSLADWDPLTPLPSGPIVDMHEARPRIYVEALQATRAGSLLEGYGIVVRLVDVEGRAVEMLRARCTADCAVVRRATIGRTDDERLAQPVTQRLQLVER